MNTPIGGRGGMFIGNGMLIPMFGRAFLAAMSTNQSRQVQFTCLTEFVFAFEYISQSKQRRKNQKFHRCKVIINITNLGESIPKVLARCSPGTPSIPYTSTSIESLPGFALGTVVIGILCTCITCTTIPPAVLSFLWQV